MFEATELNRRNAKTQQLARLLLLVMTVLLIMPVGIILRKLAVLVRARMAPVREDLIPDS